MPRNLFPIYIFIPILLLFFLFKTPISANQKTCDLCGFCSTPTNPNPPPPNYDECKKCLYDAAGNEATGSYYTVFGCLSTKPGEFIKQILKIVFGVSGGIAFISVLAGSAILMTSSGNPERIQLGKDTVTSSIIGILIIIFSVFLLRVIGYDILSIPGFG